jgi:hypothetical protein
MQDVGWQEASGWLNLIQERGGGGALSRIEIGANIDWDNAPHVVDFNQSMKDDDERI